MPGEPKKSPDVKSDFATKNQEALNENNINCECAFNEDPEQNCLMLAKAAFPNNPEKQEHYKAKIMASLEAWLKNGVSIHDFWQMLKTKYGCDTTRIARGILKFFSGEKEINISEHLKPVAFEAVSTTEKVKMEQHAKMVANTRALWSELLSEIEANRTA